MANNDNNNRGGVVKKILTTFQQLDKITNPQIIHTPIQQQSSSNRHKYTIGSTEISTAKSKQEFEVAKLQAQQNKLLGNQWLRVGNEMAQQSLNAETNRISMFYDVSAMEFYPEISAAMDILAEESTTEKNGKILNIFSPNDRVKEVLEDLFVNRLQIHTNLFAWSRTLVKYGDNFIYLKLHETEGVQGCMQMPVIEIERRENDLYQTLLNRNSVTPDDNSNKTMFYWKTHDITFNSWQIAHFRLFGLDYRLPYGTSYFEKSRQIWRKLLLAEDSMLRYRLIHSSEKRIFKVFVGNLDDKDVPAYMDKIANQFKRTPLIDPSTGQFDLRMNVMALEDDFFIPSRDASLPTPIETLPGAVNLGVIDDITFLQNKLLISIEIPKPFLGFDSAIGDGKNLALMDVRFSRKVNRIQQSLLMELNKIAIIHLHLLGLDDELYNFTLTLNNPSVQAEMLKIENLQQKLNVYVQAVTDASNGFSPMSMTKAKKEILDFSDDGIKQDLLEQRIEKGAAAELALTDQIIKRTGFFDKVDNIYGDPIAMQQLKSGQLQSSDGTKPPPSSSGGGGGSFGGGFSGGANEGDLGQEGEAVESPQSQPGGGVGGNESQSEEENNNNKEEEKNTTPNENPQEEIKRLQNLLNEQKSKLNETMLDRINNARFNFFNKRNAFLENYDSYYDKMLGTIGKNNEVETKKENVDVSGFVNNSTKITDKMNEIIKEMDKINVNKDILSENK